MHDVDASDLGVNKTVAVTTSNSLREYQGGQAQAVMVVRCDGVTAEIVQGIVETKNKGSDLGWGSQKSSLRK